MNRLKQSLLNRDFTDAARGPALAGLLSALVWCAGCDEVPTFQELTQGEKDAETTSPKVTPPPNTNTTNANQQPPVPSGPKPEEVLAQFGAMRPAQFTDQHLKDLAALGEEHLQDVTSLNIDRSQVTDAGLAELEKLPNLQVLNIDYVDYSPAGLAAVSRVGTLQSLSLRSAPHPNTKLQNFNEPLQHLANMPGLRSLDLTNVKLTDEGLRFLPALGNLEALILNETRITNAGLQYVGQVTSLKHLELGNTQITDEGFVHLAPLTSLEHIKVHHTNINGRGFDVFSQGSQAGLKFINAADTNFAMNGFAHIRGSQTLEELHLHNAGVSDLGMQQIAKMKNLRRLTLGSNPHITNAGVALLKSLKMLEFLDLGKVPINDEGVRQMVATGSGRPLLPNLRELRLSETGCTAKLAQGIIVEWKKADLPDINVHAAGRIFSSKDL